MSESMTTPNGAMVTISYGWVQIVKVHKVENGRMYLGGFSVQYDRDGVEVSRTPVTWNCVLSYS